MTKLFVLIIGGVILISVLTAPISKGLFGDSKNSLGASLSTLFIVFVAFAVILFGLRAPQKILGVSAKLLCRVLIMVVYFLVYTLLLIFRVIIHATNPRAIPDDFANWVEKMVEAAMGPYNK